MIPIRINESLSFGNLVVRLIYYTIVLIVNNKKFKKSYIQKYINGIK